MRRPHPSLRPTPAALAAALGLAASLAGPAGPASAVEPVNLVLDPSPDVTLRYRLDSTAETTVQGATFATLFGADAQVTRSLGTKTDHVVLQLLFVRVDATTRQADGSVQDQSLGLDRRKVEAEVSTRGRLMAVRHRGPELTEKQKQLLENLTDAFFVELPDRPVRPGDTWKKDLGKPEQGETGSGEFTLTALAPVQGTDCAHIVGTIQVGSKEPPLRGVGKVESDIAIHGGYAVHAKGSIQLSGTGPSVVQSFELRRVP